MAEQIAGVRPAAIRSTSLARPPFSAKDEASRSRPEELVAQFPKAFRRQEFAQLPPHVQTELESLGVREDAFGARKQPIRTAHSRWSGFVAMVAALAILASFIVGVGVGFRQIVLWISALLE